MFVSIVCLLFVVLCSTTSRVNSQLSLLSFPALHNVALDRPVSTDPSSATCGLQSFSAYCASTVFQSSVTSCQLALCSAACPTRTATPAGVDLLFPVPNGACVTADYVNVRPHASAGSASALFLATGVGSVQSSLCYSTPSETPVLGAAGSFTVAFWLWLDTSSDSGTVFDKYEGGGATYGTVLSLQVSTVGLTLSYRTDSDSSVTHVLTLLHTIPRRTWTHIALQVYDTALSYYINGTDPGFMPHGTVSLEGAISDVPGAVVRLGQTGNGLYQFVGRLQDVLFYTTTLNNREIVDIYSGFFPPTRIQSNCRCPASFPRIDPRHPTQCIRNEVTTNSASASTTTTSSGDGGGSGSSDSSIASVSRLNNNSQVLEFINDGDTGTAWISTALAQVTVTIELRDVFQVFYVSIQFYSPLPTGVTISRRGVSSSTWQVWQYYASDCLTLFSLPNNGPLTAPDAVNCVQLNSSGLTVPYSKGNITFTVLSTTRPSAASFYSTPTLGAFVLATGVQIALSGHYYVDIADVRHQYYGIYELIVTGRCNCNGHAESCNTSSLPYTCNCSPDSFTQGNQCETCLPLYNDKPFHVGDQFNAFPCRPCECYDHATSCIYEPSLDPSPDDPVIGGGGICVNCTDLTTGRNCDQCIVGHYRPEGRSLFASDVCIPCDCDEAGTAWTNSTIEFGDCGKVGGQCPCKPNVIGRRCDQCQIGYYNLQPANPVGCDPCNCVTAGTIDGNITCDTLTGQCNCKDYVQNTHCDTCKSGYYGLQASNPSGCQPCNCNPSRSLSVVCDPTSGQCQCKPNVVGLLCEHCQSGWYEVGSACLPCSCDTVGTRPGSTCNVTTGQCTCKTYVIGTGCNTCKDGCYSIGAHPTTGCLDCACNTAGTVPGGSCNKISGQCECKSNVAADSRDCSKCRPNTYNLTAESTAGCASCDCDPTGTVLATGSGPNSSACDQNSGQCSCLSNRIGQRCDMCTQGYYKSASVSGGCAPCSCDPSGTIPSTVCDSVTGQCQCRLGDSGVGGLRCDTCLPRYWGLNTLTGRCQVCACDVAGRLSEVCNVTTGQCPCKALTTSRTCGQCVNGTSNLDPDNPFGCSQAPADQPPPSYISVNSTSILLTWSPPDQPNGVIQAYQIFRNGSLVANFSSDELEYEDTGLLPFTRYEYRVQCDNGFGTVTSSPVVYRTAPGIPSGNISVRIDSISQTTIALSWSPPALPNGLIQQYFVMATASVTNITMKRYDGLGLNTVITSLTSYMRYTFVVSVCTVAGCLAANPVTAITLQAPPTGQLPPTVVATSARSLLVNWDPPTLPNGIIIFYELWLRDSTTPGSQSKMVFNPSGQYDPLGLPTVLPEPATSFTVTGLQPYGLYQFLVVAENSLGKTSSPWASGRTAEAEPLFMPPPAVLAMSNSSLTVTWNSPDIVTDLRGIATNYSVYLLMTYDDYTFVWTLYAALNASIHSIIVGGFLPFTNHSFIVGVCNSVGCVNSSLVSGVTLEAVPGGLSLPMATGYNATMMNISWFSPSQINAPSVNYILRRVNPAFNSPPQQVETGTHFTGRGFYKFPPNTIPQGVTYTGVSLAFRTLQLDALLFYASSPGVQDEYIVIQLLAGRLWLLFDTQDCPTRTTTTNDEGMTYNTGQWQQITAHRIGDKGYILINGVSNGTSVPPAVCGAGNVIGVNTGVYLGGLPEDFVNFRRDTDHRLQVVRQSLLGCMTNVSILTQATPTELWTSIDWTTAVSFNGASASWEGCPLLAQSSLSQTAVYFLGTGYMKLQTATLVGGNLISISFQFRTQLTNGLIMFAFGGRGSYFIVQLTSAVLHFDVSNNGVLDSVTFSDTSVSLCDGQWHSIQLVTRGRQLTVTVDTVRTVTVGDPSTGGVVLSSYLYVGGIPAQDAEASGFIRDNALLSVIRGSFSGCIVDSLSINTNAIVMSQTAVAVEFVRLDGCPDLTTTSPLCVSTLTSVIYTGSEVSTFDNNLTPFTEYMYQLSVNNSAGFTSTNWSVARTLPGAPDGVQTPAVIIVMGPSFEVTWSQPAVNTGPIVLYVISAYADHNYTATPLQTSLAPTVRRGIIAGVLAYTNYSVTLTACTTGGCTESSPRFIFTPELIPGGVFPPYATEVGTTYIVLRWQMPSAPSGVFTGFTLTISTGQTLYLGALMTYNVTNLTVFTTYTFTLQMCNRVGCSSSSPATMTTATLPPSIVYPPTLTVLGVDSMRVTWPPASTTNGPLSSYLLYLSLSPDIIGSVIYNSTNLFLFFTITNLTAGTQYGIRVSACTDGGCTIGNATVATTAESAPTQVPAPVFVSPSSTQLVVACRIPVYPNGVITIYRLYHNGILIYNSSVRCNVTLNGLQPWSAHLFRVEACTIRGCASSDEVVTRTQEAPPGGVIGLDLEVTGPRSVAVYWTNVMSPNGLLYYDVFFNGLFYANASANNFATVSSTRSLFRTLTPPDPGVWITIEGLLPYSTYTVQINASNTRGHVLSNVVQASMPMSAPDGILPPLLDSPSPTSVVATWGTIGRINSDVEPKFQLQFKLVQIGATAADLFGSETTSTSYTISGLTPFTRYTLRVAASTIYGRSWSDWVDITTRQDRPVSIDPPMVSDIQSTSLLLIWQTPAQPNGLLTQYNIHQNNNVTFQVYANVTMLLINRLVPFTNYTYSVEACTIAGCTLSADSHTVTTLAASPGGVLAPTLSSQTPSSVLVTWQPPQQPNGNVQLYTIQRKRTAQNDSSAAVVIGTYPANSAAEFSFLDSSPDISPYTGYDYRIGASTSAGTTYGPWASVVTRSARPGGVLAPRVSILSPTSLLISWSLPVSPNGVLQSYIVQLPQPRYDISNVSVTSLQVSGLSAYTVYSVTVTACSDGGCTESPATVIRTSPSTPGGVLPPEPTVISQTYISVTWQVATEPNGPNIRYELTRIKLQQPLDSGASGFGVWVSIYMGSNETHYEDRGLTMYTTYQYRLTAYNDFAFTISPSSAPITTFGGIPSKAANISAAAVNHTAIIVNWTLPGVVDLQGGVDRLVISVTNLNFSENATIYNSTLLRSLSANPSMNSSLVTDLDPDTIYSVVVTLVVLGGSTVDSLPAVVKTLSGVPEGVIPPLVSVVNETALRVSWTPPSRPNGPITDYYVYFNEAKIDPKVNWPSSYVVSNLRPYTVYNIQLEVCTVYACARSSVVQATTAQSQPAGLSAPLLSVLNSTAILLTWNAPFQPNGIIVRYELRRIARLPCILVPTTPTAPSPKCTYFECLVTQSFCGSQCYSGAKTCCNGTLYDNVRGYECCGTNYIPGRTKPDDVCCGGQFYTRRSDYQCCGDRYVRVTSDQVCCRDVAEDRVSIDYGDQCCSGIPFSSAGSQLCCNGSLVGAYNVQCCGGQSVSSQMICCGGPADGKAYVRDLDKFCCGSEYVPIATSSCCTDELGYSKVYSYATALLRNTSNDKCCGTNRISVSLSCCGEITGFNPASQSCADVSSSLSGCGDGTVCAGVQSMSAYCDHCDFDQSVKQCGAYTMNQPQSSSSTPGRSSELCLDGPTTVYVGNYRFDFTDTGLQPFTQYNYSVTAANSAGSVSSSYSSAMTLQATPTGLAPPICRVVSNQLDTIYVSWSPPTSPNGLILWYALSRDDVEIFRDSSASVYADNNVILPYRTYTYQLRACNSVGCVDSDQVEVATLEGAPADITPPTLSPVSSTILRVNWTSPGQPNGRVVNYTLVQVAPLYDVIATVVSGLEMYSTVVSDLVPFTRYDYLLVVCTSVGCTNSSSSYAITLQDKPTGVGAPRVIIVSSGLLEINWFPPSTPNGIISTYRLYRSANGLPSMLFGNYTGNVLSTVDTTVQPLSQYQYILEASTTPGGTNSTGTIVAVPAATPVGIQAPKNITALSAYSIFVSWDPIVNISIDQYRIILNPGTSLESEYPAGLSTSLIIVGLAPFTLYQPRIRACLQGVSSGCGTGPSGGNVRTFESVPEYQPAPVLAATGFSSVVVMWSPPTFPNGIIRQYRIRRRIFSVALSSDPGLLVNIVNGTVLSYTNYGVDLLPFTEYEYCITAVNSQGEAVSNWTRVRTLEAAPQGMSVPTVDNIGAYVISLLWNPPLQPNGIIQFYRLEISTTLSSFSISVPGSQLNTSISGLLPYSNYTVRIVASNPSGSAASLALRFMTLQSAPSGVGLISVEPVIGGRSAILTWSQPAHPNGVIINYAVYSSGSFNTIYSGINRQFEFVGLEPVTEYAIQLEACTVAGCTRSSWQRFTSSSSPPTGLSSLTFSSINATSIVIRWSAPAQTYGAVLSYIVLRRSSGSIGQVSICLITDTRPSNLQCVDRTVEPFTSYEYSVRVINMAGSTDSSWAQVMTSEAPPTTVNPPIIIKLAGQFDRLVVKWSTPDRPNGIVRNYLLQRNDTVPWSFMAGSSLNYTDIGLVADTVYSYTVTACTGGGCTRSLPAVVRTLESSPDHILPPIVAMLSSTEISVYWESPAITNGRITRYELYMNGTAVYNGTGLSYTVGHLLPSTVYSFTLTACTSGGCAGSLSSLAQTDEALPMDISAPVLHVTGTASIEVSWSPPQHPNGRVTAYELRRNGTLIQSTTLTWYIDYDLRPGMSYAYQITAYNSKGGVSSSLASASTFPSAPTGMNPPSLTALSSTSVSATWRPPAVPNGPIVNYTLYEVGVGVAYSGMLLTTVVIGLLPWTRHAYRVEACTAIGCALSDTAEVMTLEAPPRAQDVPQLSASAPRSITVEWNSPSSPNGVITGYNVYRRNGSSSDSSGKLVYSGQSRQFTDTSDDLQPYTFYEFKVVTFNSQGQTSSPWASVRTAQSVPDGVFAPTVLNTTSTTATLYIVEPVRPNGIITNYNVFINNTLILRSAAPFIDIVTLQASTWYVVYVEACTVVGCARGPPVTLTTTSNLPEGLVAPVVSNITAASMVLSWSDPAVINGHVLRFVLSVRQSCPSPFADAGDRLQLPCSVGSFRAVYTGLDYTAVIGGLKPYTKYEYQLIVVNEAGPSAKPAVTYATTLPTAPVYRVDSPLQLQLNESFATLDWTTTFDINAELINFALFLNSTALYIGPDTSFTYHLPQSLAVYLFYVELTTDYGKTTTPVMIFDPTQSQYFVVYTTHAVAMTTQSLMTSPGPTESPFYHEAWFIAVMCVVAAIILAMFIAVCVTCCCRRVTPYIRQPSVVDRNIDNDSDDIKNFPPTSLSSSYGDDLKIRQTPPSEYYSDDGEYYDIKHRKRSWSTSEHHFRDGYGDNQLNENYSSRRQRSSSYSDRSDDVIVSDPYIANTHLGYVNPYLAPSPLSSRATSHRSRSPVSLADYRPHHRNISPDFLQQDLPDYMDGVANHRHHNMPDYWSSPRHEFIEDYETSNSSRRRPRTVLDDVISSL